MAEVLERMSLERGDFKFNAKENLIPCFAHVLNIACQSIISTSLRSEAPDENFNPFQASRELENTEQQRRQQEEAERRNQTSSNNNSLPTRLSPLNKLRNGCVNIKRNSSLEKAFKSYRDYLKLPRLLLKYDSKTRWNSSLDMISRYLILQEAYDHAFRDQDQAIKQKCSLDGDEVKFLKELKYLLANFYTITMWLCSQR